MMQTVAKSLPLLLSLVVASNAEVGPVVKVSGGEVLGHVLHPPGAPLEKYFAFEGIPYARPPVGEWRFKDPEEVSPWTGVRNATGPGAFCIQKDVIRQFKVIGEEDCLFINVFTADPPERWAEQRRPVIVWVHGGAFLMGSGTFVHLHPESLLRQGVVVVSFNYRLGVMGFLNTEDKEAPGNAALKDAVLALRWVQKNIKNFGGDPDKVTILGESSGAAMVQYLVLSSQSKGLFRSAISMSGSALAPWAFVRTPRAHARALRRHLAASCPDVLDEEAIVPCLQQVDAKTLVENHEKAPPEEFKFRFWKNPFMPSVEAPAAGDAPFLSAEPQQLMRTGQFLKVPHITGFTSAEGILYLKFSRLLEDPSLWVPHDERFAEMFRHELPEGLHSDEAINALRDFYMGEHHIRDANEDPEALKRFVQLCGDILFDASTVSAARLMAAGGAPVFVYEFSHEGPVPYHKLLLYNASHVPGVAHGDDLGYVFDFHWSSGPRLRPQRPAEVAIKKRMVRLLVDFASTGNPTPDGSTTPTWPPYTADKESYMDLGTTFVVKDHVMGERIALWRRLAKCLNTSSCEDFPIVHPAQGALQGRKAISAAGCSYFSFQGIPYAKPPVGSLRFKDAQPPESWLGVRQAFREGNKCSQNNFPNRAVIGEEDCLFANVYSPKRPSWLLDSLPVFVWIHGGGFVGGSGDSDDCGPDYLVCEEVILVTFNYRLGPLGFLHLDEAAPGNAGLKDQVQALRWVQKDIAAFGGDPSKVTIGGESAGSAAVHLQMLSPLSHGLFQRAIAQSGTAVSPWTIQTAPAATARRLARAVNCTAEDPFAVVECLRGVSPAEMLRDGMDEARSETGQRRAVTPTFVPTVDLQVQGVETFLPGHPAELISRRLHHPVPLIIGFTKKEAILHMAFTDFRNETIAKVEDENWESKFLPQLRLPANSSRKAEALGELRRFYMDGQLLSNETLDGFLDMIGDLAFGEGVFYSIQHMAEANNAPLYLYSFNIDDELNMLKIRLHYTDIPGAGHADDLGYIFRVSNLPDVSKNSTAARLRHQIVRMWTNFIKTGDPTPKEDSSLGFCWKPYTNREQNALDIGEEMTPRTDYYQDRMTFWKNFYHTFSDS